MKNGIFFPIGPMDQQDWIYNFITAQIPRNPRNSFASILYDREIAPSAVRSKLSKSFVKKINDKRGKKSKIFSINPLFINKLESKLLGPAVKERADFEEHLKFMAQLQPHQVAVLYPTINFIYRYRKNKKDPWLEVAFPFEKKTNIENILADPLSRGDGSGIERVSVVRTMKDLGFTNQIEISADFWFQSLSLFTKVHNVPGIPAENKFSFMKLLFASLKKNEEILVEYGWGINEGVDESIISKLEQERIRNFERKRIGIKLNRYDFTFNEDGVVKISADYFFDKELDLFEENDISVPKNDSVIKSIAIDENKKIIFLSYTQRKKELDSLEKRLDKTEKKIEEKKSENQIVKTGLVKKQQTLIKQIKQAGKQLAIMKRSLRAESSNILIEQIISDYNMFHIDFIGDIKGEEVYKIDMSLSLLYNDKKGRTKKEIERISETLKIEDIPNINASLKEINRGDIALDDLEVLKSIAGRLLISDLKKEKFGNITFFSIRSLIEAAYRVLSESEQERAPWICLGNTIARSFEEEFYLNIGDVLVETRTFQKWYFDKFIRDNRINFTFGDFILELMENFIPNIISTGGNSLGAIKRTILAFDSRKQNLESLYKSNKNKDLEKFISSTSPPHRLGTKRTDSLVLFHQIPTPSARITNKYLVSLAKSHKFDEEKDFKNSVPYLKIGATKGLLKSINFSTEDMGNLRAAIWQETQQDSTAALFKFHYSATANLIGNNVFFKGGYFAIPSNPLGVENRDDPGIVGYYAIYKVKDTLDNSGKYETEIEGVWQYNPESINKRKLVKEDTEEIPIRDKRPVKTILDYIEELNKTNPQWLNSLGLAADKEEQKPKSKKALTKKQIEKQNKLALKKREAANVKNLEEKRDSDEDDL